MDLYEVTYRYDGPQTRIMNLGNVALKPGIPTFLYEYEMPLPLREMKKIKDLFIKKAVFTEKPNQNLVEAKARGTKGIMWNGASPARVLAQGTFKRGEAKYDLPLETVNYLASLPGFKVVE